MEFIDARIEVQHPCPYCHFSGLFEDAEMALWCNGSNDVLQITAPAPSRLEEILRAARECFSALEIFQDGRSALTMIKACTCDTDNSISRIADECEVWLVPPSIYRNGWETHRVISGGTEPLQLLITRIDEIGTVRLLSKRQRGQLDVVRDFGVVPVHFFEGLTDRQVHALVAAYENGLFEVPARKGMDRVAEREGVSRSTFGEHLRKAQLRMMRNSYPHLKLRDVASGRKVS